MQHPNNHSQWLPRHVEEQPNPHPSASHHLVAPLTIQQLLAVPGSQQAPVSLIYNTGSPTYFALGADDTYDPAVWSHSMPTRQDTSHRALAQPTTSASSVSAGSPDFLSGQGDQIHSEELFGHHVAGSLEPLLQEHEYWRPGSVSYPPSSGRSPLSLPNEDAMQDRRTLQCKWLGCRSTAIFRRESDLIRHLKTIHISPKAYPCTEANCGMGFGRKDHLKNHLKNHQRNRHV